jgi:cellobiose-specific phosphotransferase system component IIB
MSAWMQLGASVLGGIFANKQAKKAQSAANEAAQFAYEQSRPQNYQGMFGGYDTGTGEYLNEDMQAMMQQYMDRQQAIASQIGDYSPQEYAQQMYDTDLALLNPELEQQALTMESRLAQQGRLGSTGGAGAYGGLMQAQNMTRLGLRRQSYDKSQQQLDAMRRRQNEDMMSAIGIGNLASGYGGMSLNFANQRAQNAWNAANMRSGAALGRAGATAGMIGSALQGFNSQEGMSFEGLGGLFRTSKPALNPSGLYQYRPNQYSGL